MKSLRPAPPAFRMRVVDDVLDYMERVTVDGGALDPAAVLDDVIYAKVLPKLRGTTRSSFARHSTIACESSRSMT